MRRILSAALSLMLVLALLAGCSGGDTGAKTDTPAQDSTPAPTQDAAAQPAVTQPEPEAEPEPELEPGVTYYDVTLHVAGSTEVIKVKENGRAAQPDNPEVDGYVFSGWYSDESYSAKFIFSTKITESTDVYARMLKATTFEAEDLVMDDLSGPGYSGASSDYDMIIKDRWNAGASGGKFVSYLYAKYDNSQYNTTLEFHISSDAAVSGAALILRLSAEYADITINGDKYEVLVNGAKIGYDNITFEGAAAATEGNSLLPFADYTISSNISLVEGENVITLRTANNEKQGTGGTMNSTAPMVDCIKLAAEGANLSWTEGYSTT